MFAGTVLKKKNENTDRTSAALLQLRSSRTAVGRQRVSYSTAFRGWGIRTPPAHMPEAMSQLEKKMAKHTPTFYQLQCVVYAGARGPFGGRRRPGVGVGMVGSYYTKALFCDVLYCRPPQYWVHAGGSGWSRSEDAMPHRALALRNRRAAFSALLRTGTQHTAHSTRFTRKLGARMLQPDCRLRHMAHFGVSPSPRASDGYRGARRDEAGRGGGGSTCLSPCCER